MSYIGGGDTVDPNVSPMDTSGVGTGAGGTSGLTGTPEDAALTAAAPTEDLQASTWQPQAPSGGAPGSLSSLAAQFSQVYGSPQATTLAGLQQAFGGQGQGPLGAPGMGYGGQANQPVPPAVQQAQQEAQFLQDLRANSDHALMGGPSPTGGWGFTQVNQPGTIGSLANVPPDVMDQANQARMNQGISAQQQHDIDAGNPPADLRGTPGTGYLFAPATQDQPAIAFGRSGTATAPGTAQAAPAPPSSDTSLFSGLPPNYFNSPGVTPQPDSGFAQNWSQAFPTPPSSLLAQTGLGPGAATQNAPWPAPTATAAASDPFNSSVFDPAAYGPGNAAVLARPDAAAPQVATAEPPLATPPATAAAPAVAGGEPDTGPTRSAGGEPDWGPTRTADTTRGGPGSQDAPPASSRGPGRGFPGGPGGGQGLPLHALAMIARAILAGMGHRGRGRRGHYGSLGNLAQHALNQMQRTYSGGNPYARGGAVPGAGVGQPAGGGYASVRNNNPGAMMPGGIASRFGGSASRTGTGQPIASFPTPVHGAAANMANLRGYEGMTIGEAVGRWSGGGRYGVPGFPSGMRISREMLQDRRFMVPFMKAIASGEAPGNYPMDDGQWQQAFDWYMAGGAPSRMERGGRGINSTVSAAPMVADQ